MSVQAYSATSTFATLDNTAMQNPLFRQGINTRYQYKTMITVDLQNANVQKQANTLLKSLEGEIKENNEGRESGRPLAYTTRKTNGFCGSVKNPLKDALTKRQEALVEQSVMSVYTAFVTISKSDTVAAMFDKHTDARKNFKAEIETRIKQLGISDTVVARVQSEVLTSVANLGLSDVTKNYLTYKVDYVFKHMAPAKTVDEKKQ